MNLFIFINVYISSRSFNKYQDVIDLKPKTNVSDQQDNRIIVQKLNRIVKQYNLGTLNFKFIRTGTDKFCSKRRTINT